MGEKIDQTQSRPDQAAVEASLAVLDRFMMALNSGDEPALLAALHFPHYRLAGDGIQVWDRPGSYLGDFRARAGAGAKIAEVRARPVPYLDPVPGEAVMREMQRREEGRLVTGIQRHHETVEHGERRLHRRLIRSGLSLVDLLPHSADRGAEDAHVVAAGNLACFVPSEAAAHHRRNQVHPLRVVVHASWRDVLVGADADMINPDDLGHFFEPLDIFVEAWEKVPDADRAPGLGDRPRMVRGDLPARQGRRAHRPRPGKCRMRQQQRLVATLTACFAMSSVACATSQTKPSR